MFLEFAHIWVNSFSIVTMNGNILKFSFAFILLVLFRWYIWYMIYDIPGNLIQLFLILPSSQLFGIPSIRKYLEGKTVFITTSKSMDPANIPPPAISMFLGSVAAWNIEVYKYTVNYIFFHGQMEFCNLSLRFISEKLGYRSNLDINIYCQ